MLLDKVKIESEITVEELRLLTTLSQKEFANAVEIPYGTYVKKEQGHSRFFASEISLISHRFNVPIEKISA